MKLWDKRFPSKWTDFIQFFDKNEYYKSHNFRSKISIVEKEPTSFKKNKIFITPGLEDTVLSELDVVNVWREYLAIKICQKFSQRETYQWPMAQLSVHRVFKFISSSYFHSTYKLHKLRG